jgi:hypothetical protein
MRSRTRVLACVTACLLLWQLIPDGRAQGSGELLVQTDFELIGTSELNGGGHVTYVLTGDEAQDLRRKIVSMFDTYAQIPVGFPLEGSSTARVRNGVIDRGEALAYTGRLENELEGLARGSTGTDVGYFRLAASDLLFGDAIERATAGLLASDPNATSNLELRLFFDGRTTTQDSVLPLPTRAFADALHRVFSFARVQASNLSSGVWPLLSDDWHVVTIDNRTALWAGNDVSGRYDNGVSSSMRTAELVPSAIEPQPGLDFRFATDAWAEVTYRGRVADANDVLNFEVALPPNYATWVSLRPLNSTNGQWRTERIDLRAFIGPTAAPFPRFRFTFTSDAAGNDEGFFLRDFAIHAPSAYEGILVESQAHYLIGSLSFSEPNVAGGGFNLVRTPGGEILWYGATWPTASPPSDTIRFQTFQVVENPQILFVVMLVAAYAISRSQESAFDRYEAAYPEGRRAALERIRWIHWLGKISMVLIVLLYFIPSAFYNVGVHAFVSGPAYIVLAVALALGLGLGTRFAYQIRLERSPPTREGVEAATVAAPGKDAGACGHCQRPLKAHDRAFRCECGATYHLACASTLATCPNCARRIDVEVVSKKRSVSVRCASCGKVHGMPEDTDPRTLTCDACGAPVRRLEAGKGYLLVSDRAALGFDWLRDLTKGGRPGVVLTPASPERIRVEYGMPTLDVVQVSASVPAAIDPRRLDPEGIRAILPLSRSDKGGALLLDAFDRIIVETSLEEVMPFLRKASDMAFVHKITVIARVGPGSLSTSDLDRLGAEFDETVELTAKS